MCFEWDFAFPKSVMVFRKQGTLCTAIYVSYEHKALLSFAMGGDACGTLENPGWIQPLLKGTEAPLCSNTSKQALKCSLNAPLEVRTNSLTVVRKVWRCQRRGSPTAPLTTLKKVAAVHAVREELFYRAMSSHSQKSPFEFLSEN